MLNPVTIVLAAFSAHMVAHNAPPHIAAIFLAGFAAGLVPYARRLPRAFSRDRIRPLRRPMGRR